MFKSISLYINLLVKLIDIFILFLSEKKELFIFLLIFGLFLAASIGHYLPMVRYPFVLMFFLFILVFIFKYKDVFYLTLSLLFLIVINIYSAFLINDNFNFSYFHIYLLILIGYIVSKENLFENLKPYVKYILLINLYFLVNEKITNIPFVPFGEGRELSLVFYGQGIFGYTKNAADAIGLSILLFRRDFFWKFIILCSVLLIGIRSAIVFVFLIILIDFLIKMNFKVTFNRVLKFVLALFIIILALIYLSEYFYLDRIESLFRSDSATYTSRFYYATQHMTCFSDTGIIQLFFGSGTFCPSIINNGSENQHIMLFTHFGLAHYSLWLIFFIFIIFQKSINNFYLIYPLILYLLIGLGVRWGLGWMGGIILYTYIFNLYFERKAII